MTKQHYDVLLLGSVPLADCETVIRTVATTLGHRISRIPDGETGPRLHWTGWQTSLFDDHPMFQEGTDTAEPDWRNPMSSWKIKGWHVLRPGAKVEDLKFGPLGYAEAAKESYEVFVRLRREGVVHPSCKFQVSIPTPYNVIDQRIHPTQRLDVEGPYERRMLAEVDELTTQLPHKDLAIQWDAAHEVQNLDGGRPHWFERPEEGIIERLIRLGNHIPTDIELGYHLCYGSFAQKHFIEPKDTGLMVRISNALCRRLGRSLQWIHMPVPRDRTDNAYFAPLANLQLREETLLYLGLVHLTDGVLGAKRRLSAARQFLSKFGISAECGFGRRKPETIPELLQIHAAVADLAATRV